MVVRINDEPFTAGGRICFIPEANTKYISEGELAPDGSFRLTTELKGKGKVDGAPEGKYTVVVMTTAFKTGRARGMETYSIAPGENKLTVRIENPDRAFAPRRSETPAAQAQVKRGLAAKPLRSQAPAAAALPWKCANRAAPEEEQD